MADIVDSQTRSRMMARIRGKDTRPEIYLRRALHARGFRFRLHAKHLPGRPDIVLPRYGAVIFVHGCFWHQHSGCRFATLPSTRRDFWLAKFSAGQARDGVSRVKLVQQGWRIATVWECAIRGQDSGEKVPEIVARWLYSDSAELEVDESLTVCSS